MQTVNYSDMSPTERLAFCRGDDPVGAAIADDAAARQPLRADVIGHKRRHDDNAEAAELQSWLVGNARAIRPGNTTGLMAWALVALRAQSDQLLEAASAPERVRADVAVADCNDAERREAALLKRVNDLEAELKGIPRVDPAALRTVLQSLVGPSHFIRELQVCRGLPGNAIDQLLGEFNAWAEAGGAV